MTKKLLNIIKSEEQYDEYMSEVVSLLDAGLHPGTDDFDRFEHLNILIHHYEEKHFPAVKPTPVEAIKFRMDQQGLTQFDMKQFIGSASKVSEVLSEKRPLSLSMIKRIHDGLGIPLDVLIQDTSAPEWNPVPVARESFDIKDQIETMTKSLMATVWSDKPVVAENAILYKLPISKQSYDTESHSKTYSVIDSGPKTVSSLLTQMAAIVANDEPQKNWILV
ncbi:transcriptional regulator [Pectobacterium parmentieri]|uniref:helix-turn-helix domain-containing protein n=1 Tax=Pectobacterium parmentieri TaxID=1905730 RepID=UPI000F8D5D65|nr:transcriptional regulator [Pectobacterium parmentieri]AZS56755.1 transcriptional regulator [Pectobacterium parmentieri]